MGVGVGCTRLTVFVVLSCMSAACAGGPAAPGRVGELRGRIVRIDREQGRVAVAPAPEAETRLFRLAPFTSVRGPGLATVDALEAGQRVYVRYLPEAGADAPEVLSITVLQYTLTPKKGGPGTVAVPGF